MSLYMYKARLIRVVDADTVDLHVDVGFRLYMNDRFRVYGIDAWEVRGEEREKGLAASAAARQWFDKSPEDWVYVETFKGRRGKYGRWLADIYHHYQEPGTHDPLDSLSSFLVAHGHAEWVDY